MNMESHLGPGETGARRQYRMTARADAAKATAEAILDAAMAAFSEVPFDRVTLNDIASRSGVTVQTVLRRFGSKEALFAAVGEREGARIRNARQLPSESTLQEALNVLLDHYEQDGDVVLHLLSQEHISPPVAAAVDEGRRVHREWVIRHCRDAIGPARGKRRELKIAAATAATDLGTWKLLRRDLGLERDDVLTAMLDLLNGLKETT